MSAAAHRSVGSMSPRGALATVVIAGLLTIDRNPSSAGEWVATHYLYSYQDGLRKRALVGSVLRAVTGDGPVTLELATALGLLHLLVFVVLAGLLTAAVARRDREDATTALVLGVLIVGSTHARTLAFDVGRFDVLLLVILLAFALLSLWDARAGLIALPPLLVTGMLVHEIAILATAPLMTLMALHRLRSLDRARTWMLAGIGTAALTGVVVIAFLATARRSSEAAEAALLAISNRAAFLPANDTIWIQSSSTLGNVRNTLLRVLDVGPAAVLVLLVVAVPACVLAYEATLRHDRSRSAHVLGAAALSPLILMLVAHDYGRWTVLAVTNVLILALWWRGVRGAADGTGAERRLPGLDLRSARILVLMFLALLLPSPFQGGLRFPGVMPRTGSALRTSAEELLRLVTG